MNARIAALLLLGCVKGAGTAAGAQTSGAIVVIVARGTDADAVKAPLLVRLEGTAVLDASVLNAYLLHPGGAQPLQDFAGWSASPPEGWPVPLAQDWANALGFCERLLGQPPWDGFTVTLAQLCGQYAGALLWQRFLEHHRATRVYELETLRPGRPVVEGIAYEPLAGTRVSIRLDDLDTPMEQKAAQAAFALISRQGLPNAWLRVSELPVPVAGDPHAGQPEAQGRVTLRRRCGAFPKALEVDPQSALARSVAAQWAATVEGDGSTDRCTLSIRQGPHELGLLHFVTLKCSRGRGVTIVSSEAPVATVSERVVFQLAESLCERG